MAQGQFGLEIPQKEISKKASFQKDMVGEFTRDGSWCSILEELRLDTDRTKKDKQNRIQPMSHRLAQLAPPFPSPPSIVNLSIIIANH
ncbi:hypothetical protein H8959_005335 [Pygathrix nigripes]